MSDIKLVFDFETAHAHRSFIEAPEAHQRAWESFHRRRNRDKEYTPGEMHAAYEDSAALTPEFGRIVAISCKDSVTKEMQSFFIKQGEDAHEGEARILKAFALAIKKTGAAIELVGHNIKAFDIPYAITRFSAHGIMLPVCFRFYGKKPWEQVLTDTLEVWRGGFYRTSQSGSLDAVCLTFGIESPKQEITGAEVPKAFWKDEDGVREKISQYCDRDTAATGDVLNAMYKTRMIT
jgi:DNA polymerase elongation subunit (family B)